MIYDLEETQSLLFLINLAYRISQQVHLMLQPQWWELADHLCTVQSKTDTKKKYTQRRITQTYAYWPEMLFLNSAGPPHARKH